MGKYQILPLLSDDEYQELKSDIAERGVMVPIEFDEHGDILDGHHRKQICEELGITNFPSITRSGWTDAEKHQHIRKLNLARRHLTQAQKRAIIAEALKDEPQKSNSQHARELGVAHKTVGTVRAESESTGEIPRLNKTIGADGRSRTTSPRKAHPAPPLSPPPSQTQDLGRPPSNDKGPMGICRSALEEIGDAIKKLDANMDHLSKTEREREIRELRKLRKTMAEILSRFALAPQSDTPKGKRLGKGVTLANLALNHLIRIPPNDPLRQRAFQMVRTWMEGNE